MTLITNLNNLVDKQLSELEIASNNVELLYDEEAKEYAKKINKGSKCKSGYTDIDSYFEDSDKPIMVLIINSSNRLVYGTIAHELKHVRQLLDSRIRENVKEGRFQCEKEAYEAGRKELEKHSWWLSKIYQLNAIGSIPFNWFKYVLEPKIERIFKKEL